MTTPPAWPFLGWSSSSSSLSSSSSSSTPINNSPAPCFDAFSFSFPVPPTTPLLSPAPFLLPASHRHSSSSDLLPDASLPDSLTSPLSSSDGSPSPFGSLLSAQVSARSSLVPPSTPRPPSRRLKPLLKRRHQRQEIALLGGGGGGGGGGGTPEKNSEEQSDSSFQERKEESDGESDGLADKRRSPLFLSPLLFPRFNPSCRSKLPLRSVTMLRDWFLDHTHSPYAISYSPRHSVVWCSLTYAMPGIHQSQRKPRSPPTLK